MAIILRAKKHLSQDTLLETTVVPVVPSLAEELNSMVGVVRQRLFHPQRTTQVFADTLFLNAITREIAIQESASLQDQARRRLMVFELGLQAMLACPGFEWKKDADMLEKLYAERAIWDDRLLELHKEFGESRHYPLGFLPGEDVKYAEPNTFPT